MTAEQMIEALKLVPPTKPVSMIYPTPDGAMDCAVMHVATDEYGNVEIIGEV